MSRVVLAMSGGVDSSVAAWLLREMGHDVIGLFMRHGQPQAANPRTGKSISGGLPQFSSDENGTVPLLSTHHKQGCCSAADASDARRVADLLGIPFFVLNFQPEFDRIIDYFVQQYTAGRTPNPCIVCNTWLKFGKLIEYADSVGAEFVATGHYARVMAASKGTAPFSPTTDAGCPRKSGQSPNGGKDFALCRGLDHTKDQSYVLFGIPRNVLGRLLFPVGEHHKTEIRRIAERLGLSVAAKRDSQEICFVPDRDHARFVREHRGHIDTSGDIVTTDGTVVGRHAGIEHFTVGQRKGLGVAHTERRFVVRIEPESRRVVIGSRTDLEQRQFVADSANWLMETPREAFTCRVKIRYRSPGLDARIVPLSDDRFRVELNEPCQGLAPGQAAVCYDGDRVLGGGWIEEAFDSIANQVKNS
jgi:tRNA-uridine 2-sulfurtransferase